MDNERMQELVTQLEVVTGAQAAMLNAIRALMVGRTADPLTTVALTTLLERGRIELHNLAVSEDRIAGYEEAARLIQAVHS